MRRGQGRSVLYLSVLLVITVASMQNLGFFNAPRFAKSMANLAVFMAELFPPDFSASDKVALAILETLQMAFVGTLLGSLLAIPLGILGARNIFGSSVTVIARSVLSVIRTVPVLLWAIILVIAIGLGPLAGTLGIAIYSLGYLGKLYYESFEAVDPEVVEAVSSVGCSRPQLIRYAFLPESANYILSQLFFMFEYNVRASSILGFVGAGGVGFYILSYIQLFEYRSLMALIIMTLAVVLAIDYASAKIRDEFLLSKK